MEKPLTPAEARQYGPATLAFLGDSVYEVLVREYLISQGDQQVSKLHDQKVQYVCAKFQAEGYDKILPLLTEEETSIMRRGRNVHVSVPQHATAQDYHKATGLEALFGYLDCIGDTDREHMLFREILSLTDHPNS